MIDVDVVALENGGIGSGGIWRPSFLTRARVVVRKDVV